MNGISEKGLQGLKTVEAIGKRDMRGRYVGWEREETGYRFRQQERDL